VKKKRGRAKSSNDTSKQEAILDSQGEESPKEVVSRSGRKIKPKRFADFSSSEETEISTEKNGIYNIIFICYHQRNKFYVTIFL